ncbi:hypothetical protein GALMADRAFT_148222 [Galerina marginata CBS 339.88]|uniref:Beta/gamma crystallin 'Greek key' domain-containing protein n=1 Tax=Galerina marginata (strain CBS 339.88) TaxID=685588 RepID=A0A067S5J1_GALM3|nr:hypothetical protein GALMADRAFT_148222 [Galerina marginata CBS 339.88]
MYFTTKFSGLLLAIAASTYSAQAAVVSRHELAELSVVFFDDVNLTGASFSPASLAQGVCSTLPGTWLDRAESVKIGPGFACTFFEFQGCEGPGTALSGTVNSLPMPALYDNTESFFCNKQV